MVDHLRGTSAPPPPAGTFILVRREVDPADLIQLADRRAGRRGVGRAAGPAPTRRSSRAASACPCWPAPTRAVLAAAAGHPAILDAGAGELIVDPDPQTELDLASLRRPA